MRTLRRLSGKEAACFTLIELLVVVAIIGILAAMLLPVLTLARGQAYTAACQNNQKQLGLGLFMYGDEHDDALPASYNNWGSPATGDHL